MDKNDLFNKLAAIVAAYGFSAESDGWSVIRITDKTHNVNIRTKCESQLTEAAMAAHAVTRVLTFSASVAWSGGEPSADDLREAAHIILMAAALVDRLNNENTEFVERW